ncbi:MAG: ATPase, T2SS/T4P/T4SS family, partial [Acidimicrobiia bacterium]|nr:ATPase, T2SS/T4P/T4SS family [Acidimicrobiia bacterium]
MRTSVDPALIEQAHRWAVGADGGESLSLEGLRTAVREHAPLLTDEQLDAVTASVVARTEGLGRIDELLADESTTDVLINGPGPVWIERHGQLRRTELVLERDEIDLLVERIVAPIGRRADRSTPIAEGRLADGSRVHIVLPPVAVDGPCVAIRRFTAHPFPLAAYGDPEVVRLLRQVVARGDNVVVSGGTGSGKTSLLNALAGEIPDRERVLTVEDAAELRIPGDHVVRFECRPPTSDGVGAVDLRQLVRSALRLRPDRLVVGEVRGGEAFDLLQALNTGHAGSMATCHANDPPAALRRLEMLVSVGAPSVPLPAVRELMAAAVDVVVQVSRGAGRSRG